MEIEEMTLIDSRLFALSLYPSIFFVNFFFFSFFFFPFKIPGLCLTQLTLSYLAH